jgi:hypothetical protein
VARSAGVVLVKTFSFEIDQHHPVCARFGGFAKFFIRASTPPLLRRGILVFAQ